jgi:hypothetical protein
MLKKKQKGVRSMNIKLLTAVALMTLSLVSMPSIAGKGQGHNGPSNGANSANAGEMRGSSQMRGQGRQANQNAQAPQFNMIDSDSDGVISPQEFTVFQQERMTERQNEQRLLRNSIQARNFSDLDTDGDGFISRTEFQEHQTSSRRVNSQ